MNFFKKSIVILSFLQYYDKFTMDFVSNLSGKTLLIHLQNTIKNIYFILFNLFQKDLLSKLFLLHHQGNYRIYLQLYFDLAF